MVWCWCQGPSHWGACVLLELHNKFLFIMAVELCLCVRTVRHLVKWQNYGGGLFCSSLLVGIDESSTEAVSFILGMHIKTISIYYKLIVNTGLDCVQRVDYKKWDNRKLLTLIKKLHQKKIIVKFILPSKVSRCQSVNSY